MLVFADCQKSVIFQIPSDQNPVLQITEPDSLYMRIYENNCNISLFLQIDDSLDSLTQSTQSMQTVLKCDNAISYTNVIAAMKDFVVLNKINYVYMALSQKRFVLPDLHIAVNLSRCEKALCFLCKSKKVPYGSFYEDE